jgi:hypothetical protein
MASSKMEQAVEDALDTVRAVEHTVRLVKKELQVVRGLSRQFPEDISPELPGKIVENFRQLLSMQYGIQVTNLPQPGKRVY